MILRINSRFAKLKTISIPADTPNRILATFKYFDNEETVVLTIGENSTYWQLFSFHLQQPFNPTIDIKTSDFVLH